MGKIKKILVIILVSLFVYILMPNTIICMAEESKDTTYEEGVENVLKENNQEITELYQYINNMKSDTELMNELDPSEYIINYIKSGNGNLSVEKILKGCISLVFKEVSVVLKFAISMIAIAILSTLIKNLQESFTSKGISEVAFYACYVTLILLLSRSFLISITVAKEVIFGVSDFMSAVLPILISMVTLSGGVVESAILDPVILSGVIIIPKLYTNIIIPLIMVSFVLQFVNNLSEEHKISNLCKMVKQMTIWLQGIVIVIFVGILTIRGITGSTIDAVTLKTTKFAVDNFVPIVGKAFSDAITSVASYSLIIKNSISSIGLVVIILIIIYPLIKILLMAFIYKFTSALIEPISDKRITACIQSAGDSLVLLLSCVLSVSLMFFILLAVIANCGRAMVGV